MGAGKTGNGQSGNVRLRTSEVAETPVRSWLLSVECLNVKGCSEVEKKDKIGFMFEECSLDILCLSWIMLRGGERDKF